MNLYKKRQYPDPDVAYSLHQGLMLRLLDRQDREDRSAPRAITRAARIGECSLCVPDGKEINDGQTACTNPWTSAASTTNRPAPARRAPTRTSTPTHHTSTPDAETGRGIPERLARDESTEP